MDQPRIEAAVPVPVPVPSPVAVRVPAPVPVLPAPQPLVSPVASSSPAGAVVWLSASGRVPVVGESHYQPALRHAARGGTAGPGHQLIPARAVLVAEPRNAHDSNAVRVDLLDRDDQAVTVGYLARDVARRYQPVLNRIGGRTAVCPARITGGGAKFYGVYLHLGRPSALLLSNVPPDGVDPIDADRPVSVTGEEEHQAELSGRGAQPGAPVHVAVTFGSCVIARGKYAGHSGIEVRLDGRRIGQFTYAMSERYRAQLIPPVANVWAEAILTATPDRGLQVEVLLPAVS